MNRAQWRQSTDSSTAAVRAGGRRLYNAARQARAAERRTLVATVMARSMAERVQRGESFRGLRALIAEAIGVHPSTISRDCTRSQALARLFAPCPTCDQMRPRGELEARVAALVTATAPAD